MAPACHNASVFFIDVVKHIDRRFQFGNLILLTGAIFLIGLWLCAASDAMPTVNFTDITKEAGITFVHVNGAYGEKLLPETMGGGVAFLDFDGDGHQGLLFINSCYWQGHAPEGQPPPTMALYRNDGHGHFTDVTKGSGLDVSYYGMGVAIGD